jgi:GT2 family glycosyltransferase
VSDRVPDRPLVGIVVVNYNGGDRTLACLQRLHELTWPPHQTRIVLVDNASHDGVADEVASRWPKVDVVRSDRNLGFGGGCNLGFDRLRDVDYIALINNDAIPEHGWLEPLVATLEDDRALGAVTPKVLLSGTFMEVSVEAPATAGTDPRLLGVRVDAIRNDTDDVSDATHFASGFWGWEASPDRRRFQWTNASARMLIPVAPNARVLRLELSCFTRRRVTIRAGDEERDVTLDVEPTTVEIPVARDGRALINNAGSMLLPSGDVVDRGFLEPDRGQYDNTTEVFAWSGAAVVLRRSYVDQTGGFDDAFFLYYEDTEMAWHGRRLGWSYACVPNAVVWHEHSASTGRNASLTNHLLARNRLATLTLHAPPRVAAAALGRLLRDFSSSVRHDVVFNILHGEHPVVSHAAEVGRVGGGFAQRLPHLLVRRARIDRRTTVSRARLWADWPGRAGDASGDSFEKTRGQ